MVDRQALDRYITGNYGEDQELGPDDDEAPRPLTPSAADYMPYQFSGDWTDDERAIVEAALSPYVPAHSVFNDWRLHHDAAGMFSASRATWQMGALNALTAVGLAASISAYYRRAKED